MKNLLTLIAVLVVLSSAAFAQYETDHFKCYLPTATSAIPVQPVVLVDQFGTSAAKVGNIWRFCNPTVKDHNGIITPITNPDAHLALHKAAGQPIVTREVQIENQFGAQTIVTGQARFLAVPTQKEPHGPAFNLDHFNCYVVTNGNPINTKVGLTDQWFNSAHKVGKPFLFCNPVQKTHNGIVTPITHPKDHLTCYKMTVRPFDKTVQLHNQFGDPLFRSKQADMLCVPTTKLQWKVIP
ncbi:MAG: hypothetical protein HY010_19790 [Acidobacteria bacterium]|nr:hypothetical protein [Acidobacteriota bacterium]